jgi:hypothetical protein
LVSISRQYHGRDHAETKKLEHLLAQYNTIFVMFGHLEREYYQALRFEGDKCVIRGPVKEQRVISEEKTLTVESNALFLVVGTPVICHGLKNSAHLNGKIGDIRSFDSETMRYGVYFDDKSIIPKRVKGTSLSIMFDLPEN